MSKALPRAPSESSSDLDGLEELGDDAIIAQQTEAHLPQKRAVVSDEARSVVISEALPPAHRALKRYRLDRGEPTLVIRDRSELEAFRRKVLEDRRHRGAQQRGPYLWAGLALVAFAMGGLLMLVLTRGEHAGVDESTQPPAATHLRVDSVVSQHAKPAARTEREAAPPQVKLEELPVERPRRR